MHSALTVFFSGSECMDPPLDSPLYLSLYEMFAEETTKLGARFSFVRGQDTYLGGNRFSGGWRYENGKFQYDPSVIDADVIYNKGEIFDYDSDAVVVNHRELDALCRNKNQTYETMPELFPFTCTVRSSEELLAGVEKIPSAFAVLKPLAAWGGKGVWIGPKEDVSEHAPNFPCLLQEFVDTSGGIPGITDGHHDFRLILFNDQEKIALLRVPKKGSLLSNVAQGGSIRQIPQNMIPEEVLSLKEKVDTHMLSYGKRIYSMDCARNIDGAWKLIELNPQPGLPAMPQKQEQHAFLHQLSVFLLSE